MSLTAAEPSIDQRLADYQRDGYTVFAGFLGPDTVARMRAECDRLSANCARAPWHSKPHTWFGNMLERSAELMWPIIRDDRLLDFCERVVGPFVQLDNLTLASFGSQPREKRGHVSGWHRDRWAHLPRGHYEMPDAWNAIAYLQDLSDDYGPLRVIPGSHIEPVIITPDEVQRPHARETILHPQAGDLVLTHNGLLHSGTANVMDKPRYFFSIYMNRWGMCHTDNFDGPVCREISVWLRRREDRRGLRLLGDTSLLQARVNYGYREPEAAVWARWQAEDAAAFAAATSAGAN